MFIVNGAKSIWSPVLSGAPQGTVLGPLLSSLYINDISTDIDYEIRLFADDCVESIKYCAGIHVSNVCTKANRTLGFLRRNLFACPKEVKEAAFKGLVRPVLEYSGSVLDPSGAGLQNELEKV